jgi:hypothetical protein
VVALRRIGIPTVLFGTSVGLYVTSRWVAGTVLLGVTAAVIIAEVAYERRTDRPLIDRALDVANAIRRCAPGWHKHPRYARLSAYGTETDMAKYLVEYERIHAKRIRIPRRPRRYTDRLHRRFGAIIEELARAGITDYHLKTYLSEKPDPSQYENVARDLWWAANKLPHGRPQEPLGGWV